MLEVTAEMVFDGQNPERKFHKGTILKVNDKERARKMLALNVVKEVPDVEMFEELDPMKTEKVPETAPNKRVNRKIKSSK